MNHFCTWILFIFIFLFVVYYFIELYKTESFTVTDQVPYTEPNIKILHNPGCKVNTQPSIKILHNPGCTVNTQPVIDNQLSSDNITDDMKQCKTIVMQYINESKGKSQYITSNNINYALIDSVISGLECQIRDIMNRLPLQFVVGDVVTISNSSSHTNNHVERVIFDPFSNNGIGLSNFQNLYNLDFNPSYSDTIHLGGGYTRSKQYTQTTKLQPQLFIEYVSFPKIYLKFVFPTAEKGDTGLPGIDGENGPTGDIGETGPPGVRGFFGMPPLYMRSS